jgi:transmembrane sensor
MAAMPDLDHERASDEAAAWLIRLREEPGDATVRAGFEAWRAAAPAHEAAWAEVAQAFDLIGTTMPATDDDAQLRPGWGSPSRRVLGVGAIAVLTACLALVFLPGLLLQLNADYTTARGEWRALSLADGSAVDLAPQSAIAVAMTADRRDVRLLAGQAYFRVTPDAARPFQVQAGEVRATALGTAFDVRLLEGGAGVAVAEGKVRVDYGAPPARSKVLEANDWLRMTPQGRLAGNAPAGEIGAWRQGQLVAHDRTIAEVIDELRPYFGGLIVIAGDAVARRRVTGVYELRDPVEGLRAVGRAHDDIVVTRVLPWLVVVSGG